LKRHPQLAESIISVLVQYARYDMVELFTIHLKNVCPEPTEQIQMMIALFKPLTESNFTKDEVNDLEMFVSNNNRQIDCIIRSY